MPREHHRHERSHHHQKSIHKSRSRSKRRGEQDTDREIVTTCHGRAVKAASPNKSSTLPFMSQKQAYNSSRKEQVQHKFSEIDLSASQAYSMRENISKEVSPVRSYSKPEQSLDYRPRQSPTFTRQDAKTWKDKSWSVRLQKEMEGKIRQRRRSYSFSSSVEKGYHNGANIDRAVDEKRDFQDEGMGSLHFEYRNVGFQPGQHCQSKNYETTSSNDTVFNDKVLFLSDLYPREKVTKYSDSVRSHRKRTKSESRGISKEKSPANENHDIVNLLKDNRRPLEVDAKEFRVLKEKLLRNQLNLEQPETMSKTNIECELKLGDTVNKKLNLELKDDEVSFGKPGYNHKEIALDSPSPLNQEKSVKLKSSRSSRFENYQRENFDYTPLSLENNNNKKYKTFVDSHFPSKENETKMEDSLPLSCSSEEKECLKEKLLKEFKRQENRKLETSDKFSLGTFEKENEVNIDSSPCSNGQGRQNVVSSASFSLPCTCGVDLSPKKGQVVDMKDSIVEQSYSKLYSTKSGSEIRDKEKERPGSKIRTKDWNSDFVVCSSKNNQTEQLKKDSFFSAGHLQTSSSPYSRHREGPPRECLKPATIPRESSPAMSCIRDISPNLFSSESCDFRNSQEQASTKQNSRHSLSCESSLPRSPPPYVHPKDHKNDQSGCDCHYSSQEYLHGHINGGFHRGSVRSTDCPPFHCDRAQGEGPFHIDQQDNGGYNHHIEHTFKNHLQLYPDIDSTRSKVNIVIFSGGIKLRRQHWCFLALVLVVLIICLGVLLPNTTLTANLTKEEQKNLVAQILTEVPLIDGHNDLPWNIRQFIHNKLEKVNLTTNIQFSSPWSTSKWSHTDLYRMKAGMVGAQLWTAYAPCGSQHKDAVQITLEQIDLIKRLVDLYPDYLQLATTAKELVDAHKNGKIASVITVESGHSIGTSLGVLRTFQRLGVRALTLTHNCDTPWADCSNADKPGAIPQHNGLTEFGKTVVVEMNKLGIMVDLSHASVQTARDALSVSKAPIIFSHSSAYALCNASRNVPDDVLRIVAEKRGLVMINFFSYFLTCSNHSTLNDVVNHINHIRNIAGIESVGIGASYDGINEVPVGLPDVSHYPELFVALLDSGSWGVDDIKKLAGQNFLRVLMEVEQIAKNLSEGVKES